MHLIEFTEKTLHYLLKKVFIIFLVYFYINLTATRMEDMENIGNMDNSTPTHGTE